ncbi:acyl-CoA desaturase [Amycolatopsis sp. NPDC050768]|uniref:fatty acid desaturase family protein n=1 Tax=Amycolatopsis sp. NPDC050768 TaxID=3154839 RepID=UPI0033C7BBE8
MTTSRPISPGPAVGGPDGSLKHVAPAEAGFSDLQRIVARAGLLGRRRGYYAVKISLTLLAFAGGCAAFAVLGDTWWQLVTAGFFAVMSTQLAFIGHDAGHRQIFRSRQANNTVGYVHAGLVGISYGWWIDKHNRHHTSPNHEEDDPDLDIPMLAFTSGQSRDRKWFVRFTAKYQAFLFLPLLLLEGLNLHWASIATVGRGKVKARKLEATLLVLHTAVYLAAIFLVLSPPVALAFIAVHQGLWGVYMGCSFAPGHKGMPTYTEGASPDFLRKQVLSSRNVRGGAMVDFVLGGLNYQVEHHLFPSMPRTNLRAAQRLVQQFCAQHSIEYTQCGLLRSYGHVLQHLHRVSAPLRARSAVGGSA